MPVYISKQGDCISSIADQFGFFWETVWNDDRNAGLRAERRDANVLQPGDLVFVPDKRPKEESGDTGLVHKFRLKGVPVRLQLRLLDEWGDPRAGLKYSLSVDGASKSGIVPEDGFLTLVIEPQAKKGTLRLETGEEYLLNLGALNPVEYTSGVQDRLKSLGYYKGEPSGQLDKATRNAIEDFQMNKGLPVTGDPDADTRAALVDAHQC